MEHLSDEDLRALIDTGDASVDVLCERARRDGMREALKDATEALHACPYGMLRPEEAVSIISRAITWSWERVI